jgi:hypothetical protein
MFSPDGRFLFYSPEIHSKPDPNQKRTVRLLELASGKDRPWAEHPTESASVGSVVGQDSQSIWVLLEPPGSYRAGRKYLVPWTEEPVPQSAWSNGARRSVPASWRGGPGLNFFYGFKDSKLLSSRIDPKTADFGEPQEVQFVPGPPVTFGPDDRWFVVRSPGLVFSRERTVHSVWLMDLPHSGRGGGAPVSRLFRNSAKLSN